MANYAKIVSGKVVTIIVAEAEFFNDFVDDSHRDYGLDTSSKKKMKHGNYDGTGFFADSPHWTLNSSTICGMQCLIPTRMVKHMIGMNPQKIGM